MIKDKYLCFALVSHESFIKKYTPLFIPHYKSIEYTYNNTVITIHSKLKYKRWLIQGCKFLDNHSYQFHMSNCKHSESCLQDKSPYAFKIVCRSIIVFTVWWGFGALLSSIPRVFTHTVAINPAFNPPWQWEQWTHQHKVGIGWANKKNTCPWTAFDLYICFKVVSHHYGFLRCATNQLTRFQEDVFVWLLIRFFWKKKEKFVAAP